MNVAGISGTKSCGRKYENIFEWEFGFCRKWLSGKVE